MTMISAILLACAVATIACLRWPRSSERRSGGVDVVDAPHPSDTRGVASASPPLPEGDHPLPLTGPRQLADATTRAFPMLYNGRVVCGTECTFQATFGPANVSRTWQAAETPYHGNMERFLTSHGLTPLGTMTIDQPPDGEMSLRVPIAPPPAAASPQGR
ncbi:hypothetical protein [Sphingomonas sp.]|uniref:hypothetical protein n=1 Tax=Sphingomonas sp. TaxID=28214 RepID=UPI00258E7583|nr:hypothetical protein [Sphingomonas sp.]